MDLSLHDHSNLEDNVYLEQLELSHWTLWLTGLTGFGGLAGSVDSLDSLASEMLIGNDLIAQY